MENEDVKKVDVIDEDTKSTLSDLLSLTRDIRKMVVQEIKKEKQILENFDIKKEEYMQDIEALKDFNEEFEEKKRKTQLEELRRLKEKLNG